MSRGKSKCKVCGMEECLVQFENSKDPVGLEQSKQRKRVRDEARELITSTLTDHGKYLGFLFLFFVKILLIYLRDRERGQR